MKSTKAKASTQQHIKLVRYTPRSGGMCRIIGAVWQRNDGVHWASPIVRKSGVGFDPQPFMSRFPDAAFEVDHFSAQFSAACQSPGHFSKAACRSEAYQ